MFATRLWRWAILIVLAFTLPGWGQEPPRQLPPAKTHVDLYGDPLPKGAIARLGSVRFRHPGAVWAVAFSPDGKLLAASSDGLNRVILWERATGRMIRAMVLDTRPSHVPLHLRFSADGKRLYGCSWYRDIRLHAWDVESGKDAKDVPPLPAGMGTLGYSPDGREMLLLHRKAEIVRWDIDKGKELGRYPSPGNNLSTAARVGERVLVPYFDGEAVGMWDVAQNKRLWSVKTSRDKRGPGKPMAFSADGKLFAVEAPPGAISVYESITGKTVRRLEGIGGEDCLSLGISPDARFVVGAIGDDTWRLWDLESGRERFKVPGLHISAPNFFFAPDSKVFATGGPNNPHAVLLWDAATGKQIDPCPGHTSPVSWVSFSPDGRMAATSSWIRGDTVVRVWETRTGRLLRSLDAGSGRGVTAVAFSPDGGTLAACGWYGDNKVRLWDVATGRERHTLVGHQAGCTCVAFAPDGKRLASGDAYYNRMGHHEGRLCIWDAEGGKLIREIRGTRGAIQRVLFTHDGRHVLAAANGVHVYDADTGQLVGEPFHARARIWGLALSADSRLLATANQEGAVRLWELATRREIPLALAVPGGGGNGVALAADGQNLNDIISRANFGGGGNGVALTLDGRTLAASSSKGGVVLFHWPSGETVGKLSGDTDIGTQVFFSPDGRRLATAENDESSALIWDVAGLVNRPLPAVAKPAEADLRRWWTDLRDDDPGKAYKAVWRFAAVPDQALPFLADSLRPVKASEPATVARLIDDLDSSEFRVRERASRELERLGEAVVDALRKAKKKDGISVEQRQRLDLLLAKLANLTPGPEQLRASRAMAALEQIGGSEAQKVLTALASGASSARLTREAKGALERLKRAER